MAISITHAKRNRQNFIGATYHITCRCNNRELLFKNTIDFQKYLSIINKCKERYSFKIYDYSSMNNHTHLILELGKNSNISKIMHSINRWYANWYNKEYKRTGHFWEERFYAELINDDLQLLSTMVYMHLNPVKARLCKRPTAWKFSGANYYLNGVSNNLLTPPDIYMRLGTDKEERLKTYAKIMEPYFSRISQ